jgi:pimeloyl-ACP methyl ester carboxylesterase
MPNSTATASAGIMQFPRAFKVKTIAANGAKIHVRVGGKGPPAVLLHGFGETGDMWAPLAVELVHGHTVIVPDLRGMGLSSRPAAGYDKKTQGEDIAGVLDALKVGKVDLVTHDIGNMVGYAFAAEHPDRVAKFVLMDAPLPGIGPWEDLIRSHKVWHFSFYGPDAERLVKGRERIYLDRFWNEADDAGFGGGRREVVRSDDGDGYACGGNQCDRGHCSKLRPLGHGGESVGDHQTDHRLPVITPCSGVSAINPA